ncbi:M15 family metallopeptidase [Ameyamaea chiangmaiensis]|uniref:D-alanyl-D-alanine dipeptidase n=2 Tax=Ameyamaea chiangmaiensis TaxID=442969 RepID=A0A850P7G3_9PROT|nr:M15 family metallopeptidase [Ameyamaea chiangmaiensis]NVN40537.1 M15 family metallopeptidase [Ameyamaea chiangmaiensis]
MAQDFHTTAFRIQPTGDIATLRQAALSATPPHEAGPFRTSDLVELVHVVPALRLDIRYATSNNFLGVPLYTQARAFLQRPAAEALARVQARLAPQGYGLVVYDGYRPWYVTKLFWEATPVDKHMFVGNPVEGSRHNRGCAVDLGLCDLETGATLRMPSGYDEMTKRAYADYPGGTDAERRLRHILRTAMEAENFAVLPEEWWHFDHADWSHYPIMNTRFEDLE